MNLVSKILSLIFLLIALISGIFFISQEQEPKMITSAGGGVGSFSSNKVIKIDFDNTSNCGQNNAVNGITATARGTASCFEDNTICKWYGCGNFTTDGGDYFNLTNNFVLNDKITVAFWIYPTSSIDGGNSQYFWEMSTGDWNGDSNYKAMGEGAYGMNIQMHATTGDVTTLLGESKSTRTNVWTHYCAQYDGSTLKVYKNGVLESNVSRPYGNLNYTSGEVINIGKGVYGIDLIGYMDEFEVWNSSEHNCVDIYDEKSTGTPPNLDLYVKDIYFKMPFNYSNNNSVEDSSGKTLQINITIRNEGVTYSTGSFRNAIKINNSIVSYFNMSLNPESQSVYSYNWTSSVGFAKFDVIVDVDDVVTEDFEDNNEYKFIVPFKNRPWHIDRTEWLTTLKPYCDNSNNMAAYSSCDWTKNFLSEDFNNAWSGNDVDPRGKKGYENAQSCFYNNWDPANSRCVRATNHLFGWGNRTVTTYNDVQAIHQLIWVGMIYDLMFPTLNESSIELISNQYEAICQQISNLPNVRPDTQSTELPNGGNGIGFGSGMGSFCDMIIGTGSNPTLRQDKPQDYDGLSLPFEWDKRTIAYLKGGKNDSYTQYQEGSLYKWYSQNNLVWVLYIKKIMDVDFINDYQNYIDAMGREQILIMLDNNYNGSTLRNDKSRSFRSINRGDSNSYEDVGSDTINSWGVLSMYAYLTEDVQLKKDLMYLRDYAYNMVSTETTTRNNVDFFMYAKVKGVHGVSSNLDNFPKFFYDVADDIVTFRNNYTYRNDTLFQIDGGEERGGGHSQAQGFYFYALGEPFLDYEQVPYEDNARAESYKNTITLVYNLTSYYSHTCGNAQSYHYYGMGNCVINGTYPNFKQFPMEYSGDVENVFGLSDGLNGGAYRWIPLRGVSVPAKEYYIYMNGVLYRRGVVSGSPSGKVIDNNLNILDEFPSTVNGLNITLNRTGTNKQFSIDTIWVNSSATVQAFNSTVRYGFTKRDTPTGKGHYQMMHLNISSANADWIRSYQPYYVGQKVDIEYQSGNDKGAKKGDDYVFFDTNNDGVVEANNYKVKGWGFAYDNAKIMAFNVTNITTPTKELLLSSVPVSVSIVEGSTKISININTYKRSGVSLLPQMAELKVNISSLSNTTNAYVQKNGVNQSSIQNGDILTFNATSSQLGDEYIIFGGGGEPPVGGCVPADYALNLTKLICGMSTCIYEGSSCVENRTFSRVYKYCDFVDCE